MEKINTTQMEHILLIGMIQGEKQTAYRMLWIALEVEQKITM